ncbi:MAG: hypothetical protein H6737_21175 [Alphaproteobacteria bacterium]|nr:hypothetical protein [Alphaproteobacteria bacterium]
MIAWLFAQSGEVDDRLLGPMLLRLPGLLGGVLLGAVIGWARATTRHRLVVTPHRIAFEGSSRPPTWRRPGEGGRETGEIQRISIGDEVVAELAPGTRMWTFEQATWAARRIADLTGQPFVDARDRELWARWQRNPRSAPRAVGPRARREPAGLPLDHAIRPEPPDSPRDGPRRAEAPPAVGIRPGRIHRDQPDPPPPAGGLGAAAVDPAGRRLLRSGRVSA